MEGPKGHKVHGLRKWTVHYTKVNGTQKCVGGQKGMKVDGPQKRKVNGTKIIGGQEGMKVDGPQNAWAIKKG